MSVLVMLAVNDEGGNFTGECDAVEIGDLIRADGEGAPLSVEFVRDLAEITVQNGVLVVNGGARLGEGRYRYWNYRYWVGNCCWDGVRMKIDEAGRLLEQLRTAGWGYDEAEESLAQAWEAGEPLAPVLARLCRVEAK